MKTLMSEQVLDRLSIGVLAIDNQCRVTEINTQGEELLQLTKENALGKSMFELFSDAPEEVRHVERTIETQKETNIAAMPYHWGKYDMYLSIKTKLLRDQGEIVGAMVEFGDVTGFYEEQRRLINQMEDMCVNIIPLYDKTALFPLQPVLTEVDFSHVLDEILNKLADMDIDSLIIDFSTIFHIDHVLFDKLNKLIQSITLMGVQVVVSGMKPALAKGWVGSNIPSLKMLFFSSLNDALKYLEKEVE
ncbi:PAS domain-containing protein [Halobacillus yeomjeoni]|uniref:STAS domain-containing protein n=1 Tax=Halobacillus yeomjeoni TaxID=311194 RepID=UPI001CD1C33E|nr:STAS domain-containing protein [Halobacillus yeomjeoni]MCA0982846.1 PAS domain-containing protein [Halobacillus yeomjeoni]